MPNYADEESDAARLPEGMQRVGYDDDTQVYTYRDQDGTFWEGDSGVRYGELHRVGEQPRSMTATELDTVRNTNKAAWRQILPFFLLTAVFLLTVFKVVSRGENSSPEISCGNGSVTYTVKSGDSCWSIVTGRGGTVEDLKGLNPDLVCEALRPGMVLCIPGAKGAE